MEDSAGLPLADVVGKWKDVHQQNQVIRGIPSSLPESNGKENPTASNGGVEMPKLVEQCSQTVAWLAQVIMEDRHEMRAWMGRIETSLENHGIAAGRAHDQVSDRDRAPITDEVGIFIQSLISEELSKHRVWASDNFRKLAAMLSQGTEEDGLRFHPKKRSDEPLSMPSYRLSAVEDFDGAEPSARVSAQASEAAGNTADATADLNPKLSRGRSSVVERHPERYTQASEDLTQLGEEYTLDSAMSVEASRMTKHLNRMKRARKQTTLYLLIMHFLGYNESEIKETMKKPNNFMVHIVESNIFTTISLSAVIINGVWIGYQTQVSMRALMNMESLASREAAQNMYREVNRCFSVLFAIELVCRFAAYRVYFFTSLDRQWNLYDIVVVLGALFEEVFNTLNLNFLRTLRVVRLVRVTKVIRVLRFFQGLRYLLCTLVASASMLYWTVVFLGFIIFVFAIIFMQAVTALMDENDDELRANIDEYYGSLLKSMYTLTLIVTGGNPWERYLLPLREINLFFIPVFVGFVVLSLYGIMNIVTAVFVEHAKELKQRDKDLAIQREMEDSEAFGAELRRLYEETGWGEDEVMDWEAFKALMNNEDAQLFLSTHNIDVSDAEELFVLLDVKRTATVAVDDFIFGCLRLKGTAKGMDLVLLYDEIVKTRNKVTAVQDKQRRLLQEFRSSENKLVASMSHTTQHMNHLSADFYVQMDYLREMLGSKTDSRPHQTIL